ncbi:MAG: ribbon-helix-helix protein, CopG family [Elusimicrobiota bacterium]|nr:ribbon-helix-helix protein, CopG family [Elusimicrobiota bacterium]
MPRTTAQWTVSLPPALSQEAEKLARKESRTRSELIREALRNYIENKRRFEDIRRQVGRNLAARGVRTLQDIEAMIDEGRK